MINQFIHNTNTNNQSNLPGLEVDVDKLFALHDHVGACLEKTLFHVAPEHVVLVVDYFEYNCPKQVTHKLMLIIRGRMGNSRIDERQMSDESDGFRMTNCWHRSCPTRHVSKSSLLFVARSVGAQMRIVTPIC